MGCLAGHSMYISYGCDTTREIGRFAERERALLLCVIGVRAPVQNARDARIVSIECRTRVAGQTKPQPNDKQKRAQVMRASVCMYAITRKLATLRDRDGAKTRHVRRRRVFCSYTHFGYVTNVSWADSLLTYETNKIYNFQQINIKLVITRGLLFSRLFQLFFGSLFVVRSRGDMCTRSRFPWLIGCGKRAQLRFGLCAARSSA